ncbi:MAG TPA: DUF1343 domain-containing protein, partial [bacterium]
LEAFVAAPPRPLARARLGLLCNQASVDRRYRHARDLVARAAGRRLTALFSPQHGVFGEKQDNMVESAHGRDPALGIPVYSLYADVRRPTAEMLAGIDALLVDLQDVGCRVYTFITTLRYCLEEAARLGKRIVVLDRPNPIGGAVEGNLLTPAMLSFVGAHPLPMRHGLTLGELARLFVAEGGIDVELDVVPLRGWHRRMLFRETGLPWVPPSPNMPAPETALVYPGQVLLEGTLLSEGRGTTRPFEFCGAPWIDPPALCAALRRRRLPGVVFREAWFQPTFQKWAGKVCGGLQLHVTDAATFRPYRTTLALLAEIRRLWPGAELWRQPPYEYETERLPIDLLTGDARIRAGLDAGRPPAALERAWSRELAAFEARAAAFHLYR